MGVIVTTLPPSNDPAGNWTCVFFRHQFMVANPAAYASITVQLMVDDGAVVWINGNEVGRINVPGGELVFNDAALVAEETRTLEVVINNPSAYLQAGANVIAVMGFNANLTSSDFVMEAQVVGEVDLEPPLIEQVIPPSGATVRELTTIEFVFSESVVGVDASDLLINGVAASSVQVITPSQFLFEFDEPMVGPVSVEWIDEPGITDTAADPNLFPGGQYSFTLDPNAEPPGIIISEFVASNNNSLNDEDGDSSDWIELYNAGTVSANLGGWFLTDNAADLTQWRIPGVTLLPGQFLIVFASGKDRTNIFAPLHANFTLRAAGEFLALVNPDLEIVSAFSPAFPEQFEDVSYGRDIVSPELQGYFDTPTPGAANSTRGSDIGPEVVFSLPSKTFTGGFNLVLTTPDNPSAQIRYVIVNNATLAAGTNVPTQASALYTAPIPIQGTVQIRARSFVGNQLPGPPRTENYIQLDPSLTTFTSDLPLVVIHNFGSGSFPSGAGSTLDRSSMVMVFDTKLGSSSLTNSPDTSTRAGINLRGSSTQGFPKSSYAVEFWDELNQDFDHPVLDMASESDWVLYSPNQFDISLIHNPLAFELSNAIGEWAPRTRMVEVFVNTAGGMITGPVPSGNYNGIYVLSEKIKRNQNRLDIDRLEPEHNAAPQITGGYLLKVDRLDSNERSFSAGALTLIYQDPDGLDMVGDARRAPQVTYIRNYINSMYQAIQQGGYENWIDEKAFIDHNLVNMLTINVDGFRLSGYMHKPRDVVDRYGRVVQPGKFKMGPVWDFDRAMGTSRGDQRPWDPFYWKGQGGDTGTDWFNANGTFTNPWYLNLFRKIDFWQKYVDRYQELREGAFSEEHILGIIDRMGNELRQAQVREDARWGGNGGSNTRPRTGTETFFGYSHTFGPGYQGEIDFQKKWFVDRLLFIDTNFLDRPTFSSEGGQITPGHQLSVFGPPGATIYYTLDGTDPRAPGGNVAQGALMAGGFIILNNNARVVARSFNANHRNLTGVDSPPLSTPWSGKREATFVVNPPPLRITEIMYHPPPPQAGSPYFQEDLEYIEVKNIGASPINLNRYRLSGGVDFNFGNQVLLAGQSAVVVSYLPAFNAYYNTAGLIVAGEYKGLLANEGDHVVLEGPLGEVIHDFDYQDDWYPATDGFGFSLVIRDETGPLAAWNTQAGWRPSAAIDGSPGMINAPGIDFPTVIITEALTHTDAPSVDTIELYNAGATPADIGGWWLSDDFRTPKYRIPDGTTIQPGDYAIFTEAQFNQELDPNRFNLRSSGDDVYLFSAEAIGTLTGYIQGWEFDASLNGVSFGLYVTSTGAEEFVPQTSNTLPGPNSGPRVGPVVISEIMYHPRDIVVGNKGFPNNRDEYVELQNTSINPVPLYDPNAETNTFRLRDAVSYTFPMGITLLANSRLLVVGFDPANTTEANAFRARFSVPGAVPLFGPFEGNLSNGGESVELIQPDVVVFYTNEVVITGVEIDRVEYSDSIPWPVAADGLGPSLQRLVPTSYGNDPTNWLAAIPTAGNAFVPTAPPVISVQPISQTIVAQMDLTLTAQVTGPDPLSYQWLFNGVPLPGATSTTLDLDRILSSQEGVYQLVAFNGGGSVSSDPATITVLIPAEITQQPKSVDVVLGENVSLSVAATSSSAISFQWYRNGELIPGATGPVLNINPVEREDDGTYHVVVTDAVGPITSDPAVLTVLIEPEILNLNTLISAVEGSDVVLSIEVDGTLPMSYRWRRGFSTLKSEETYSYQSFHVLQSVQMIDSNRAYSVVMTNKASFQPGLLSPNIRLYVLPDGDSDQLPDSWESDNGISDPNADADMDGVSNRDEYLSNTDPNDPGSYLKVEGVELTGDVNIVFQAAAGMSYSIFYRNGLEDPIWKKFADIVASETSRIVHVPDPTSDPIRIYQLVAPRQP